MNNTFNIKRFGFLIKRHLLEYGKIHLITLGVVAGAIIAIYGFNYIFNFTTTSGHPSYAGNSLELTFREPLFVFLGIIFISISANQHFVPLGQKPKAIIALTLPASTFEKFLIGILFSVILAIVSYLIIFYLVDLAFVSKLRQIFHGTVETYNNALGKVVKQEIEPTYFFEKSVASAPKPLYVIPLLISSIFLLGSVYFNKFHYVKTMVSLMIFFGLWITFLIYATKAFFDNKILIKGDGNFIGKYTAEWGLTILIIIISMIFWTITYIRLREKEV